MIVRCADCGTPTVRDVCPQCVGNAAWQATVTLAIGVIVVCFVLRACGVGTP